MGKEPRPVIGWQPPKYFSEILEPLPQPEPVRARHMHVDEAARPVKIWGNWNIDFRLHRRSRVCTCEQTARYQKVFRSPYAHVIHFGNCVHNTEAALLARQFASDKFPAVEHALMYGFFVKSDWDNRKPKAFEALDSLDYSWETFLAETEPKKRKIYQRGKDLFLDRGRIDCTLMAFSKTNEVHHTDEENDPRPRCLFDPHATLKAVGAYCARLMIAALKPAYPEFVSGLSTPEIARFVSARLEKKSVSLRSHSFYSYDGSGHDSHQSMEFIEAVDHLITRELLPHILARSWIPEVLHAEVLETACRTTWNAYTIYGAKFRMTGTVFSGHPFRTTLFNTLRTIYYNLYTAWIAGCEDHTVFAAGDDVFGHQTDPNFYGVASELLSPFKFGIKGLGQVAKDFTRGPIADHSFLSKRFYVSDGELYVDRNPDKLMVSGTVSDKLEKLHLSEFCTMQYLQLSDITDDYGALRERFARYGLRPVNRRMADILKFDWGYKLHLAKHPKPEARHPKDPHAPPYYSPLCDMHDMVALGFNDVDSSSRTTPPTVIGGIPPLRGARSINLSIDMARKETTKVAEPSDKSDKWLGTTARVVATEVARATRALRLLARYITALLEHTQTLLLGNCRTLTPGWVLMLACLMLASPILAHW